MALKPKDLESGPFLKPLGKKRFRKEARSALRLAFKPAERQIEGEIRASKLGQKRTRDYFKTYGKQVDAAGASTAAAYQGAQASIGQASSAAADYAEKLRQRMASEAQEDAARRGVPYDPSGSSTMAEGNLARINAANTLSGVTGIQGAAQAGYYADKARIGQRESVEQRLREQARRRSLKDEKRDMVGDKAAQLAQMFATSRDSERDFYLGLKAAQEPGKGRRFDRKQSAKDRALTRNEARRDRKSDRNAPTATSDEGKNAPNNPPDRADISKILALLREDPPPADRNRRDVIQKLLVIGDDDWNKREIRKAYKRYKKHRTGPRNNGTLDTGER